MRRTWCPRRSDRMDGRPRSSCARSAATSVGRAAGSGPRKPRGLPSRQAPRRRTRHRVRCVRHAGRVYRGLRRAPGDGRPQAAGADDPGQAPDAVHAPRPHRGRDVPGLPRQAAWWIAVPPVVLLTGYLLLLREAAHADAEARERQARERSAMARQAREARRVADAQRGTRTGSSPAWPAHETLPAAEIIDISARVGDRALRPVRRRPAPRRRRLIQQRPGLQLSPQFARIVADEAGRRCPCAAPGWPPDRRRRVTASVDLLIAALVAAVIAAVVAPRAGRSRSHGDGPPARRARSPGLC